MDFNSTELSDLSDCSANLSVLDFKPHNPCKDFHWNLTACDTEFPCEVRLYWLEIHPFVTFTRAFLSYGSLFIIIVGVLLNALSFYIFQSSGLARKGSGVYLVALSICDSGNLIVNMLSGVLRSKSPGFNALFQGNEWLCRSHAVGVEVFQTISAWIVVAFTVERSMAVWYPFLFRLNRKKRAKIVVTSLTVVFTIFCLPKLYIMGFERDSVFGYEACETSRTTWEYMAYVRIALQTWLPTAIVFTFNCLMFWKLRKVKAARKQLTEYVRKKPPQTKILSRGHSFGPKRRATNPMLLAVSITYLILVLPLGAVQTFELYWELHHKVKATTMDPDKSAYINWQINKLVLKHVRSFFFGLYQLNFAINFFLYFAAGVEFRRYLQNRFRTVSARFVRNREGVVMPPLGPPVPLQGQGSTNSNATTITTITGGDPLEDGEQALDESSL